MTTENALILQEWLDTLVVDVKAGRVEIRAAFNDMRATRALAGREVGPLEARTQFDRAEAELLRWRKEQRQRAPAWEKLLFAGLGSLRGWRRLDVLTAFYLAFSALVMVSLLAHIV